MSAMPSSTACEVELRANFETNKGRTKEIEARANQEREGNDENYYKILHPREWGHGTRV